MKHTTFFFISVFFLLIAFFHGPLYTYFPNIFEPIHKFITDLGPAILYIAGFLALGIAVFTGLPTWLSLVLFVAIIFTGGLYLQDKNISFKADNGNLALTVVKKTISVTPVPSPPAEVEKKTPPPNQQ